jgi:hypothetical protein
VSRLPASVDVYPPKSPASGQLFPTTSLSSGTGRLISSLTLTLNPGNLGLAAIIRRVIGRQERCAVFRVTADGLLSQGGGIHRYRNDCRTVSPSCGVAVPATWFRGHPTGISSRYSRAGIPARPGGAGSPARSCTYLWRQHHEASSSSGGCLRWCLDRHRAGRHDHLQERSGALGGPAPPPTVTTFGYHQMSGSFPDTFSPD